MHPHSALYDQCERTWNSSAANIYRLSGKTAEAHAHGAEVIDDQGETFLDFACSYGVFLVGHTNAEVVGPATDQLHRLAECPPGLDHDGRDALRAALARHVDPVLSGLHFAHSGAEACEMTLRLIRAHHPERRRVVVAENAYHGKTLTALDVMGQAGHQDRFGTTPAEVVRVPYGDRDALRAALTGPVAALFLEPVLGGPFIQVPPAGYLAEAASLCRRSGALLVLDEIQTGFGRSGHMIESAAQGVTPDVLFLSKGLTGGCTAMACVLTHERLEPTLTRLDSPLGNPMAGQPLACASAVAAIETIERHRLLERAREQGDYLIRRLREVTVDYPDWVLEVPGQALMTGLKCRHPGVELLLLTQMEKRGIHLGYSLNETAPHPILRFYPPLTVRREQIDRVARALADALAELDAKPRWLPGAANLFTRHKYRLPRWFYKRAGAA